MSGLIWKTQLKKGITTGQQISEYFDLSEAEKSFFSAKKGDNRLAFAVTPYFLSLAGKNHDNPIRRQIIPSSEELIIKDYELNDPLGEKLFTPCNGLIHRYKDRALLLVTDACAVYCRHCFRRNFSGRNKGMISDANLENSITYLENHPEIHELLLSGGDPLTLTDNMLRILMGKIRKKRSDIAFRLCTRMPVVLPQRITKDFVNMLKTFSQLLVVTQFNHPSEITKESRIGLKRLVDAGIAVWNQSVLLKGINDDAEILKKLFLQLGDEGVKPYYLFQGDLAAGTGHFRVSLKRGFSIINELHRCIPFDLLPVYAVDLPGGGGKIRLTEDSIIDKGEGWYSFKSREGKVFIYNEEPEQ